MRLRSLASVALTLLMMGLWFVALRPQSMGGSAAYVTIRGTSMLPTYETGDLVITKKAPSYKTGDIAAYRVPAGDVGEGIVVIHRIVGGSAAKGFVLLGDNNPERDDWFPKEHDVVGKAWIRIPKLGIIFGFLHSPLPLACLAATIAIIFVLFPGATKKPESDTWYRAMALCGRQTSRYVWQ